MDADGIPKKAKTARTGVKKGLNAAKKKFASKFKDVDFVIKVKDEEGKIVEFEGDDLPAAAPAKKKKKAVAKTVRADSAAIGSVSIEAEDTLAMIKNALKSGTMNKMMEELDEAGSTTAPKKKKVAKKKAEPKMPILEDQEEVKEATITQEDGSVEDFQISGDLETTEAANKKAGGKKVVKKAKKGKKKKERVDGITRFFNDYGESPHLQAIEMSYLTYLEAQHAKESHLKAVKKM